MARTVASVVFILLTGLGMAAAQDSIDQELQQSSDEHMREELGVNPITTPQIQEILAIDEAGQDFFLQITDARPDTGGLSGATPGEAVTWNKVDPDKLPDMLVCYLDSSVALPLLTHYALARHAKRPLKQLYHRLGEISARLEAESKAKGATPGQD